jgi:hypothetical protein
VLFSAPPERTERFSEAALRPAASFSPHAVSYPSPSSIASEVKPGEEKPYFFRMKLGDDAFAVAGNERFLQTLMERLKNQQPSVDHRVVCVCTEEPRVCCGDKGELIDVLRASSMRGWIRRDVVMCRSPNFSWVELPVIPFVSALERGEKPSSIAQRRLDHR